MKRSNRIAWVWSAAIIGLCAAAQPALAQPCEPAWTDEFKTQVVNWIHCFLPLEEDGQTVYYLGAGTVWRWDGTNGIKLGDLGLGNPPTVWALAQFDDGTGAAIYAGGSFFGPDGAPLHNIAKWDGQNWSPLGPGTNDTVRALQVWDDGTGPALYASGFFTLAEGQPGRGIAKWDGKEWHALGTGLSGDGIGRALTVFKVGGREQLVVGGDFLDAGGVPVWDLAAWDGRKWSAFGPPLGDGPSDHTVIKFGLIDLGQGPALYAVGRFVLSSNKDICDIARWNGRGWDPVGHGVGQGGFFLSSIAQFDPGGGPRIAVGGDITGGLAVWDGATWTAWNVANGNLVRALQPIDAPSGPELLIGGENVCARWNGSEIRWGLAPGGPSGSYGGGPSLARLPMADGVRVFLAGNFHSAGDHAVNGCASYGADGWRPTGVVAGDHVYYLATFDDGTGAALYGAGDFPSLDKLNKSRLAKWNGKSWDLVTTEPVKGPLFVHDDGTGPAIYAPYVGKPSTVAKWDGMSWTKLPAALGAGEILDFASFDDGSGPSLIVAGTFQTVDGQPAGGIARWDGLAWHTIGDAPSQRTMSAVAVFDPGFGSELFAASKEPNNLGTPMNWVMRWTGTTWKILETNFKPSSSEISDLVAFNDGKTVNLYALGSFEFVGATKADGLARWNYKFWAEAFGGASGRVMMPVHSAGGNSLWVAGYGIDRFDTCPSCAPDFDKSAALDIDDFIAFQTAFALGDLRADFTGDGTLDADDFIAFAAAFAAGCP